MIEESIWDGAPPGAAIVVAGGPEQRRVGEACCGLSESRWAVEIALALVLGLPDGDFERTRRGVLRRQIAMYLVHVGGGVPMQRVGEAFGRDRSTVGHACRVVEDRRDEVSFDRLLDCLERAFVALAEALEICRVHRERLP